MIFALFSFAVCLPVHLLFPALVQQPLQLSDVQRVSQLTSATILETINSNADLSIFATLISTRPALKAALSLSKANLTLIAPRNDAFGKFKDTDPEKTTEILLYHIINGALSLKDLEGLLESGLVLESLGGENQKILARQDDDGVVLNGHVKIEEGDVMASNGIIHQTSKLLMPPPNLVWMSIHSLKEFGLFVLALKRSNLDQLLKNAFHSTVFPPTNTAFKELGLPRLSHLFSPSGNADLVLLLLNHISPFLLYTPDILLHKHLVIPSLGLPIGITTDDGDIVLNGEATVVSRDLIASNGVIHGLDTVLESKKHEFKDPNNDNDCGDEDYSNEEWYKILTS